MAWPNIGLWLLVTAACMADVSVNRAPAPPLPPFLPTAQPSCCWLIQALFSLHEARELESREAELSRRDTFYKEQLGRLEKKVRHVSAAFGTRVHPGCRGERSLHSQFPVHPSSRPPVDLPSCVWQAPHPRPFHKLYSQR